MSLLSHTARATLMLRAFGFAKIPLLWACRPSVIELNDEMCVVKIPNRRKTRNHEGGLYIAAMSVGAELAAAVIALFQIRRRGRKAKFIYKDFEAHFLKRAEGDVHFTCSDGETILKMVDETVRTGERVNRPINVIATVPSIADEPVAQFVLTLSLRDVSGNS
ncbi:MAG TPA: DUF4442 domain-containing protein [Candidatus Marinimicrobia bacterium]|jgi:hypothetical protein|nr:DUF4442 domain-containing protein [Candidatus Neomarinimicrobiota bacterium]